MIVIGSMIGSGIFIVSAESSRLSGAPGWLMLAWALAGLLTITGALCCSELATMMPRAGGVYVFLREAYGSSIGFLYGWTLFLVIQTGTIAAVAIAFARFLGVFVAAVSPDNYLVAPISLGKYAISLSMEQLVAIALIALLTWTNTRGLEIGKIVQNTFTFAKTAALAAVVVIGLSLGWKANSAALSSTWWNSWANGWNPQVAQPGLRVTGGFALALLFGRSMVGPLFAQTAWTNVTFIGSEVRDPGKNLVRALVGGCGVVVVLYLLANAAYLAVLPFPEIRARTTKSRCCGDDECALRPAWRDVHGRGDYDFHIRLQQWTDSRRSACVLCDGARSIVFPKNRNDKSLSCSRSSAGGAGNLDSVPGFAAHGDSQRCDTSDELRERLQSTARIHRLSRLALLPSDGRCGHPFTPHKAGCGAPISHVGLSDCADRLHCSVGAFDC